MAGASLGAVLLALVSAESSGTPLVLSLDALGTSRPGDAELADGELVFGLRARAPFHRHVRGRLNFDFHSGLTSVSEATGYDLRTLWVEFHDGNDLSLRVGRGPVPVAGLVIDGVLGHAAFAEGAFVLDLFGGLRALGGGRQDLTLREEGPSSYLPLLGGGVGGGGARWQWSLAYAYSHDEVVVPQGFTTDGRGGFADDGSTSGVPLVLRLDRPEHAIDAFATWRGEQLLVVAGATAGTRDTFAFMGDARAVELGPTATSSELLAVLGGFLMVDLAATRTFAVQLVGDVRAIEPIVERAPATGSAVAPSERRGDVIVKLRWHPLRQLRVGLRSRLRVRDDDTAEVRGELAVAGERLVGGLGVSASFGLDRDVGDDPPMGGRRLAEDHTTVSGALTWEQADVDASLGVLYTGGIGTDAALSALEARTLSEGPRTRLFPLALETAQVAFVRAFWTGETVFAGVDVEVDLDGEQVRSMLQVGWAP